MIELPKVRKEPFLEFEKEKVEIREIYDRLNKKAWPDENRSTEEVDMWIRIRNEFIVDQLKANGISESPDSFGAYHYFKGSSPGEDFEGPFDTENGDVLNAIREASKYL